jgi:two-component system sensor histidine kinase BaeS
MTQPLDALIEASGRIEAGDYTARVPVSGGGDMRSLTRAFNQMSAQLQSSDERRRAFLADVSHELRTPLTIIQGQLEAIEDGVYEPDRERISALLAQTRQMAGLVEDLRTISLAEVGALELEAREIDLGALAEEVAAAFAPAAELAGLELLVEPTEGPVIVACDPAATQRVVGNLVNNALRYSPAGSRITIVVGTGGAGFGRLDVADQGPGIEPDLAARAFERFEKGAESDGSGLGLAIARDLVEAQGGSVELVTAPGEGTRVRVRLPLASLTR